jgi:phospholipase C
LRKAELAAFAAICALLSGCNGGLITLRQAQGDNYGLRGATTSPIQHVVIVIQENRTFNDFFATFPGADGTTTGKEEKSAGCGVGSEKTIALKESGLVTKLHGTPRDLDHAYKGYDAARDRGSMDGFDTVTFQSGPLECSYPYQYTDPSEIKPYWDMAEQYALAEHMFTTQGSSSFTAHQALIAGDTVIAPDEALVDLPSQSPWGCNAPQGTRTSLITKDNVFKPGAGPYPCLTYPTLRDRLDAKNVTWRYYVPPMCCSANGKLLNAFDAIAAVRNGSEWHDGHIAMPQQKIFGDIAHGRLQEVSWVIPDQNDSDHPGTSSDTGPSWVASVVNAIGESAYWNSTAIVIVWDDWGGLYDNLNPPQLGYGGLGFRVPAIIVSPYAKPGYISKTQYEFGSILKYIEQNWQLKPLDRTDKRATSIADCFDYSQRPIAFKPIKSKYPAAFFLHEKPSYAPVDTDL